VASLPCPHCGEASITIARKLWLGPAIPTTCSLCSRRVGVPFRASLLALSPFFIGVYLSLSQRNLLIGAYLWISSAALAGYIYILHVPLIRR
jgi:hypothetical protein